MKPYVYLLALCLALPCGEAQAQKNKEKASLTLAKRQLETGKYRLAYENARKYLQQHPGSNEAQSIVEQCDYYLEQERQRERSAYNEAVERGTESALRSYISQYPKGEYKTQAENRIKDLRLWDSARRLNTQRAYEDYLAKSSVKAYRAEAEERIADLKAESDWRLVENSDDIDALDRFVSRYPNSSHRRAADARLHLLRGERAYANGNAAEAYEHLAAAKEAGVLTSQARTHLDDAADCLKYEKATKSGEEAELQEYYKTATNHERRIEVSNRLALLKARKFNRKSSESDFAAALAYANDDATRSQVNRYADKAREARAEYERKKAEEERQKAILERKQARRDWRKDRLSLGASLILGADVTSEYLNEDDPPTMFLAGAGLRFRLGRHTDIVNILFGLDYQCNMGADPTGYDDEGIDNFFHTLSANVALHLNTFRVGKRCKFYLGGALNFGLLAKTSSDEFEPFLNKSFLSVDPTIGLSARHVDFGIFYRLYLGEDKRLFSYSKSYPYNGDIAGVRLTFYGSLLR